MAERTIHECVSTPKLSIFPVGSCQSHTCISAQR